MRHKYALGFPASSTRCIAVLPWPAHRIVAVKVPIRGLTHSYFGFETQHENRMIFFADTAAAWPGMQAEIEVDVAGDECQRCGSEMPIDHPFTKLCNVCLVATGKAEPGAKSGGGAPGNRRK